MPYRHVIWDWNGTLLDDTGIVIDVMNELLERRALPLLTPERYRALFRFPVSAYYQAVGFDFEREPFHVLADEWIAAFRERWKTASLHPGALSTISALREMGVGQSVLSAADQETLDEQAAHFGIAPLLDRIVGIDNHHAASKLEHGRRWLEELAVDPAEVLLIGDTTHDFEVGTELGTDVVLIDYGHQSRERLELCGVPVFASLNALVAPGGPLAAPRSPVG